MIQIQCLDCGERHAFGQCPGRKPKAAERIVAKHPAAPKPAPPHPKEPETPIKPPVSRGAEKVPFDRKVWMRNYMRRKRAEGKYRWNPASKPGE